MDQACDREVLEKIIETLSTGCLLEEEVLHSVKITASTKFTDDLALDSLQALGFVGELENVFKISLPTALLADVQTVGDTAEVIAQILKDKK